MNISAGTIARTAVLILALVNQVLVSTGHSVIPVDDAQVTELITLSFTIASAVICWWKNNSFSKEAIEADKFMHDAKELNKLCEKE